MISPRLAAAHAAAIFLELLRVPAFSVPTIAFPAMFYVIFGLPYARSSSAAADATLASFVAFSTIGVVLFQFGVGVAVERGRPWERYLRSLPVSVATRLAARVIVALLFGIAAAGLVAVIGRFASPVDFDAFQWLQLFAYAAFGAVPFVLIGLSLAYWVAPRAALPVTNIIYLLCSFAGGLWIPPEMLPKFAAAVSPYLPMRQYGELLWSIGAPHDAVHAASYLLLCALVFGAFAAAGYRRDERARYA